MWHGYVGIEDLGLTAQQRSTLITALQGLGPPSHAQPSHRNHWRVRLDSKAVIFEAEFDDADWTVASIKARLSAIFGVDAGQISHTITGSSYGPVVTFQYPGSTNKLRMIAFSGVSSTWPASRQACSDYLLANLAAWEVPLT